MPDISGLDLRSRHRREVNQSLKTNTGCFFYIQRIKNTKPRKLPDQYNMHQQKNKHFSIKNLTTTKSEKIKRTPSTRLSKSKKKMEEKQLQAKCLKTTALNCLLPAGQHAGFRQSNNSVSFHTCANVQEGGMSCFVGVEEGHNVLAKMVYLTVSQNIKLTMCR